jgi:hypothetical protein
VLDEIERSSRFKTIGIANGLRMEVFAITAQRRLRTRFQIFDEVDCVGGPSDSKGKGAWFCFIP